MSPVRFVVVRHAMRSLLTSVFIPVGLLGSTVFAADVAVNRTPKPTLVVRRAVLQAEGEKAKEDAPAEQKEAVPAEKKPAAPRDEFGEQTRSHRVQLSSDGLLPGTISVVDRTTGSLVPAVELNVLFMQNGEIKSTVKPGVAGVFQAKGLAPGIYSVIASGKSGFLAFGLEVQAAEAPPVLKRGERGETRPVKFQEVEAQLAINALAVPLSDVSTVVKLVNSYVPAAAKVEAPTQLLEEKDLLTTEQLQDVPEAPQDQVGKPEAQHSVALQPDGKLIGRMRRMHPQSGKPVRFRRLNVFLVQGDSVVSQSPVTEAGLFEFKKLRPGDFSVVAAGPEGFSAFAIRVVAAEDKVAVKAAKELVLTPVSFNANRAELVVIDGMVIDMTNFPEAVRQLAIAEAAKQGNAPVNGPAPPGALGAQPGGAGAGGAGAGGGGGLGLIAAALGAAGLGLAAANNGSESATSP